MTTSTAEAPAVTATPSRTRYHFVLAYVVTASTGTASQNGCTNGTIEVAPGDTRAALFARCVDWVRQTRAADPAVLQGDPVVLFFSLECDEL